MTPPDPRPGLDGALAHTGRIAAAITPAQLDGSTPCEDMSVGVLAGHVVNGMDWFSAIADGASPEAFPGEERLEDVAGRFDSAAARVRGAWADDGRLAQTFAMPWGPTPGWQLVSYLMVEVLVHGWDLAKATGQAATAMPDDLAAAALASVQQWGEETLRMDGMFRAAVAVPDGAPITDRLVAYLGRTP